MQAVVTPPAPNEANLTPSTSADLPATPIRSTGIDVVLVVDDSDDCRDMFAVWLSMAGFGVLVAGSGMDALKVAREAIPSLILMDVCLPGLDGCEVTRRLKNDPATRHIPIIALTALSGPDASRLAGVGFEAIVLKPCRLDDLASQVSRALEGRGRTSSVP